MTFDMDPGQNVLEGGSVEQVADFLLRLKRQTEEESHQFQGLQHIPRVKDDDDDEDK